MKWLTTICSLAVILYFSLLTSFAAHVTMTREVFAGLAGLVVLMLLLVSFVLGLAAWPQKKFRALVPMMICLIGLPVGFVGAVVLGDRLQNSRFQKNLPRYTEVVQLIEQGKIKPAHDGQIRLPDQYADLAYDAYTWTNHDGRIARFMTEAAFPLCDGGYLYVASGVMDETNLLRRGNFYRQINTNWFYF
jgi:hypothetical protein